MAVIADVAARAGLSAATVSKYLKNRDSVRPATARRIEEAIEELHYVPSAAARMLRTGKTNLLSVVLLDITNPFYAELFEAIRRVARDAGYTVLLQTLEEVIAPVRPAGSGSTPAVQRVDGMILCFPEEDGEVAQLSERAGDIPLVVLNWRALHELPVFSVVMDFKEGIYQATRHLLERGRRRLAYVGGPEGSMTSQNKHAGFLRSLREAGRAPIPELEVRTGYTLEVGYAAAAQLLTMPAPPDALVCENDILAMGAIKYCLRHGIPVPEKIAVTGCDDIPMAAMYEPAITSVHPPFPQLAEAAVESIRSENRTGMATGFPTPLVIRRSSGGGPEAEEI